MLIISVSRYIGLFVNSSCSPSSGTVVLVFQVVFQAADRKSGTKCLKLSTLYPSNPEDPSSEYKMVTRRVHLHICFQWVCCCDVLVRGIPHNVCVFLIKCLFSDLLCCDEKATQTRRFSPGNYITTRYELTHPLHLERTIGAEAVKLSWFECVCLLP